MRPAVIAIACLIPVLATLPLPATALDGKLGVHGTLDSSRFSGELPPEGSWQGSSKLGGGLVLELDFRPDVSLGLQPGYTSRATQQVFKRNGQVTGKIDYEVNYLALPLLVRVTGEPLGVRGFVTAGLELGILLETKIKTGTTTIDDTDSFENTTFGALFGAGALIPVGRQLLSLEIRYTQGLTDVIDRSATDDDTGLTSPSLKYTGLQFQLGYLFVLGGD